MTVPVQGRSGGIQTRNAVAQVVRVDSATFDT